MNKKKLPRVSNPQPLSAQEEASPVNGVQVSADESCSRAGVQFSGDRTQFLVLATTVPLGWEGRLGDTNGGRVIL